jgi:hypothetical protein
VRTYAIFSPANVKVCGFVAAGFAAGFPGIFCVEVIGFGWVLGGAGIEEGVDGEVDVVDEVEFVVVLLFVESVVSDDFLTGSLLFFISSQISATFFSVSTEVTTSGVCVDFVVLLRIVSFEFKISLEM